MLTLSLLYQLRRSISDVFRIHVIASSTPPTSPLITLGNTTFFHVRHGGLWLVAVCKNVSLPDIEKQQARPGDVLELFESAKGRRGLAVRAAGPRRSTWSYTSYAELLELSLPFLELITSRARTPLATLGFLVSSRRAYLQSE